MELYNSEEEQVEALKAWWDKNGRNVIIAIIIALLGVFGWQNWQKTQRATAENASMGLQKVLDTLQTNSAEALETGRRLTAEQPGTVYSAMASLAMARAAVEKNDLDGAAAYLQAAQKNAEQPELQQLARLNLSRVLLAQGKADEALRELQSGTASGIMQAAYDEQRGDILLAQDKKAEARDAYINALNGFRESQEKKSLVQLKLDDLAERVDE